MFHDVIFLSALILVLFIIWLALKINIHVRRKRADSIKEGNLANYVTFVNNFKKAEAAEGRGDKAEALRYFRRALEILHEIEEQDEMTQETIEEVQGRIAALEGPTLLPEETE